MSAAPDLVEASDDLPGFRSRAAWRDVVAQLRRARERADAADARLDAIEANMARLSERCAAAEAAAWSAEAELALSTAGLGESRQTLARRLLMKERPTDVGAFITNLKEQWR